MIAEDLLKKLIPDLLPWSVLASSVLTVFQNQMEAVQQYD